MGGVEDAIEGRTGGVLVMEGAVRVSLTVWKGGRQLRGRTGEGVLMKGVVRASSTV